MIRLSNPLLPTIIIFLFGFSFIGALPSLASSLLPNTVNDAPIIGQTKVLYDPSLGTLPAEQEFSYTALDSTFPDTSVQTTQTFEGDATRVDTTPDTDEYAGYTYAATVLDRSTGYAIRFSAQVVSENHAGSDKNGDLIDDRAGFSVTAISSDGQYGIELGFWEDEIWAQEGGTSPNLFTHAEGSGFDTTTGLIPYELMILSDTYSLVVTDTLVLSGTLRDYTALTGLIDPYETPNFIFFGDDTTSADGDFRLSDVSVMTNTTLSNLTITEETDLAINNLGIMDIDADGNDVVSTLTVNSGKLTVTTSAQNGLTASDISGNGTNNVVMTGSVGEINATLALSGGLVYRSALARLPSSNPKAPTDSSDTLLSAPVVGLTFSVNDNGNTGTGGAQTAQKSMTINITSLAIQLATFEAHAERDQILINWQTVSELDNLGFNLYRSQTLEIPTIPLNHELIASQAPGSGQGMSYQWIDDTVEAGESYYYWLEDVDSNGNTTQHAPISATANRCCATAIIVEDMTATSTEQVPWGLAALGLTFLIAKKLLRIKAMAGY